MKINHTIRFDDSNFAFGAPFPTPDTPDFPAFLSIIESEIDEQDDISAFVDQICAVPPGLTDEALAVRFMKLVCITTKNNAHRASANHIAARKKAHRKMSGFFEYCLTQNYFLASCLNAQKLLGFSEDHLANSEALLRNSKPFLQKLAAFQGQTSKRIDELVAKGECLITSVFPTAKDPASSFCYTTGLTELDSAEIVICDLDPCSVEFVIDEIIKAIHRGEKFKDGDTFQADSDTPTLVFKAVSGTIAAEHAGACVSRYGAAGFRLLQAFFPDEKGIYPWQPGCDPSFRRPQCSVFGVGIYSRIFIN